MVKDVNFWHTELLAKALIKQHLTTMEVACAKKYCSDIWGYQHQFTLADGHHGDDHDCGWFSYVGYGVRSNETIYPSSSQGNGRYSTHIGVVPLVLDVIQYQTRTT